MSRSFLLAVAVSFTLAGCVSTPSAPPSAEAAKVAGASVVVQGAWSRRSSAARGVWKIVERNGARYVVLSDEFRVRPGPDLKLFLSPLGADEINGRNATKNALRLGRLHAAHGGQVYEIPQGTDLMQYRAIVIHCEFFAVAWSVGALR